MIGPFVNGASIVLGPRLGERLRTALPLAFLASPLSHSMTGELTGNFSALWISLFQG